MPTVPSIPVLFEHIRAHGAKAFPKLRGVKLRRCAEAEAEHAGRWRQFMHYGHFRRTICYSEAAEDLGVGWQIGLIAHELGHAAADAIGCWEEHGEADANVLGSAVLGTVVRYRGRHRLEWAPMPAWLAKELR